MSNAILPILLTGVDDVSDRLRKRLRGLTDEEYLWEPVPDMWTVRLREGEWLADAQADDPAPAPVTTIAWRMWHIAADCLGSYLLRLGGWPLPGVTGEQWYGQAAPALVALDTALTVFRDRITGLGEDGIWQELGPMWGTYADDPWAALVVHALDELGHHGAEIALMRDLYLREPSRAGNDSALG